METSDFVEPTLYLLEGDGVTSDFAEPTLFMMSDEAPSEESDVVDAAPVDAVLSDEPLMSNWLVKSVASDSAVDEDAEVDVTAFDHVMSTDDWSDPPVMAYSTMNRNLTAESPETTIRNRLTDWLARPHG